MYIFSCVFSGFSLFLSTYKTNNILKIVSFVLCYLWFSFVFFFNLNSFTFVNNPNIVAYLVHTGLLIPLFLIGFIFKKPGIMNSFYSVFLILIWSILVDSVDYLFIFPEWSAGSSYFSYIFSGIIFNLPKCILPMCLSCFIILSKVNFSSFNNKKLYSSFSLTK